MTQKSSGQVMIEYETELQKSVDKALDCFKQSDYADCRINAYPTNTKYSLDVDALSPNSTYLAEFRTIHYL